MEETNTKFRDVRIKDTPADTNPLDMSSIITSPKKTAIAAGFQNAKNKTLDWTKQQLQELSAEMVENIDFPVAHINLGEMRFPCANHACIQFIDPFL
jgi:hypothetical protein